MSDRALLGEEINKETESLYKKEKKLGEGTYAVVYLGQHVKTGRTVAIKKIKLGNMRSGLDMSAVREVKALRELQHPNVIELIDVFSHKTNLNLIVIKDKSLVALAHCHRSWILHRDLKPNNFLIASDGQLKLADFGLARDFGDISRNMTSQTVTRWYRAPELLFGAKNYTGAIDIWAMGCIFAELLLRAPYLPGDSDMGQLTTIFSALGTPTEAEWPGMTKLPDYCRPLNALFSAATQDVLDLMGQMLAFDPAKRITAEGALRHAYFTNSPRPTRPAKLPKPARTIAEDSEPRKRPLDDAFDNAEAPIAKRPVDLRISSPA
ncbi:Pkinase-domain-containing protein [Linderina pennispora]|uniref:[RNA-polymerase]-subunit kinase n=1 Tax=Linderina pennispora TaxID=61395 RepID=A0A1Y1W8D0_9FUNG|nr:Pkinase-domain-containing protein [Linderina pennispora]ORX69773.1 Pkinase-domain-containing protein [Linderina pennispora]